MRLLVATTNAGKLREIHAILAPLPIVILGLDDVPPAPEPAETGSTFLENARIKARAAAARTGLLTVAEDSGLVIDALDGAPGIHSARFLGPEASYSQRFAEIERRLQASPERPRRARFTCALSVVDGTAGSDDPVFETVASVDGEIARSACGTGGFGYDPIFFFPPYGRTFGEVSEAEKLAVAHRGQAFRQLAEWCQRGIPGR